MTTYETIKITELPEITNADGTAIKVAVQSGETSQITKDNDLSSSISSDANNALEQGTDNLLFVQEVTNVTDVLTTKGDLIGYSTGYDRLPVGTDGQVIEADSTEALGVKWVTPSASGLPTGYINGLLPSNGTDTDHEIDISTGKARSSDDSEDINVTSVLTVDIEVSGANGLDTGSVAADTWYHVFVCTGSSGECGLFSTSVTSPTLPAGYDIGFRRLGSVLTDASSNILNGTWRELAGGGIEFQYSNNFITDYFISNAFPPSSLTNVTLSVPPIDVKANLYLRLSYTVDNVFTMYIEDKTSNVERIGVAWEANQASGAATQLINCNDGQIRHRYGVTGGIASNIAGYEINTLGFQDERIA